MTESLAATEPVPTTPRPERGWHRWLRALAPLAAQLRTAPLTLTLIAALWVVGAATGSLGEGPSPRLLQQVGVGLPTLDAGHWWAPAASLLWCSGIGSYVVTTLLIAVIGPPAEQRLGSPLSALVLLLGQMFGSVLGTYLVRLGIAADLGWTQAIQDQAAVGPTVGVFALAAALSYRLTVLWRRRLRLLVVLVPLVMMLYIGHLQSVQRVAAVAVGFALGALLQRRLPKVARHVSRTETRVLVALCLIATAIGPLVASLYQDAIGPFNTLGDLYFSHVPSADEVQLACEESVQACARAHSVQRFFHSPGLLMAALVPFLLLVLAEGLRRGLRLAWWITTITELLWIGVLCWLLVLNYHDFAQDNGEKYLYELIGEALLLPVLMLALLLRTRRSFDQRLPRRDTRRLAVVVGGTLLLACAAYVGIGWLVRDQYEPDATIGALFAGLPSELLPPAYNDLLPGYPIAAGGTAQTLEIYCGVVFWAVALIALLLAFRRPVVHVDAEAAARARELLTRYGGSTLSFISTWDGNHYWFDEQGEAAVPYRVIATVALTTGDPFGEPAARRRAVAGFARYCDTRGWTPCFYSVTPETLEAAEQLGWRSLQVAEDTVVPLPDLAFTGKKWQDIRTSLNKAGKQGITAEWWSYPEAPIAIKEQVRSISEEWVSDKGLPEMGFTLGGLAELDDPAVRVLVAVDADRTVHGLTSWMPVYENGEPVGWTLDFMRRRSEGFRGVMEFLIASAALGFKEEGARFLSLSGAPLARADRGEPQAALQRMLDWMGKVLEPVYGFRSLLAFKAKFQPEYRPMYMVYPDPAALGSITRAIGKAYLPHLTPSQGVRLMRRLSS
ncbi:phosphatidylglycerol lysyltransferase domain-containing protein [Kitasatospora sp. McL0602]|uniref:phosphatidylglycerol lysyltransferase domain-containing protein n=1 Tax=Kitasatospora sp. McL0602 TaxID=3439530 RepID=UPI003F8B9181